MPRSEPRNDPRFRRYRAAAYGVYIAVVSAFCIATTVSVGRSVAAMTPRRLPPAAETLTLRECIDAAEALWKELEAEREKLVRTAPARKVDQEWMRFRTEWLRRLREEESRCAIDARDRAVLKDIFKRLEQVQDLYTIHAVQYAGEVGGAVDALQSAFRTARSSPAAGRLR